MKIQLTIGINFISYKANDKERIMHSENNNIEVMINDKKGEVIKTLFQSLLNRYQGGLETSVRGSDFIFDCIHLLYHKCHKINFKQGVLYIDSSDWNKSKKIRKE